MISRTYKRRLFSLSAVLIGAMLASCGGGGGGGGSSVNAVPPTQAPSGSSTPSGGSSASTPTPAPVNTSGTQINPVNGLGSPDTVAAPVVVGPLSVSPSSITFRAVGQSTTITSAATGFSGSYTAVSANTGIATVSPASSTSGIFTITAVGSTGGTTTINVSDGLHTAQVSVSLIILHFSIQ